MRRLLKLTLTVLCAAPIAMASPAPQQNQQQNPKQAPQAQPGQKRAFHPPPQGNNRMQNVPVNRYDVIGSRPPLIQNPYAASKSAVMEGKKLFNAMNCVGCHGPDGGGGMGPPLSDNVWIYGSTPADIYLTIAHGRPGGMPAWGTALPPQAIWALVTYVKTLPNPKTAYDVENKLSGPPPGESKPKARIPKKRPSQLPSAKPPKKPSNTTSPPGQHEDDRNDQGDHG